MVQVRVLPDTQKLDEAAIEQWLSRLSLDLEDDERLRIVSAVEHLKTLANIASVETSDWAGESDPLAVGLEIVYILSELRLSVDVLIAGLIYRSVREQRLTMVEVTKRYGSAVARLLDGVLRMAAVSELTGASDAPVLGQSDTPNANIRRMLIAMVDDVRVALIKLAERTVAMRVLKTANEIDRQRIAGEVFSVYAPLAHRLGIGHLKWELEDLSFRYTHGEAYHRIAKLLDGRRLERNRFIERVNADLTQALGDAGLVFQITGRAKHIYSIWRKMQRKGIGFSQVHDIRALRILVESVRDCYHTLGIVHGMWRNIPNEFDDYIASPKENGYRSLHTAVIGPEGKILEVQIRTHTMHEEAELGVCAHWRYKGSDSQHKGSDTYEEKLAWLRQVLEWHEALGDDDEVAEQFSFDSAQDRVYVFTPKGDVVSLIQGATPLDFAYHVHTEVGHRCRGAKVNGSIVPLTHALRTGERVEILTGTESKPRRDWLLASAGYLRTSRARGRVHQWFKEQTRDDNVDAGRALVERECSRLALRALDYKAVARQLGCNSVDDLFAGVGAGDITSGQVVRAAQSVTGVAEAQPIKVFAPTAHGHSGAIRVDGVGNMLTKFARCCMPVPGDLIEGYITRSRGVSVHRVDCNKLLGLKLEAPGRIIAVSWGGVDHERFEASVAITAYDRQGLLADITAVMAREKVFVTAINTQSHSDNNTADMRLHCEVASLEKLGQILAKLSQLDNVISARRVIE